MPTTSARPESESRRTDGDLVLLIHGTFAGRAKDEGESWWQLGSPVGQQLQKRLPAGARLPERGEVFHWSGENSERARIKAGHDLLERLQRLESAGQGYHLIGHSHGGSVIWHALREATLRKVKLQQLRSWSTVGTPFLHCRTYGAWSPANLINVVLALLLLHPAYNAFRGFFKFAWAAVNGRNVTLDIPGDREVGLLRAFFRAPVLKVVEWAGVPLHETTSGIRLGSYDSATGQSLFEYLFGTWEGLIITLVVLFGGYVFLILASVFLNPVLESLRMRLEKRLERTAMSVYGGRWLGLWSRSDEAINGLRATLDLSVSFVSQMARRDQILWSDHLTILSRPYSWVVAWAFNHAFRPLLDRAVRSRVVKTAQGNNRPAAEVIAVAPTPVPNDRPDAPPPLPQEVDSILVEQANLHASDIAPKLRNLLAAPSFVAGLERLGQGLTGHELIHTSYFDHAPILDLLSANVAWGCREAPHLQRLADDQRGLWDWFCGFKRSLDETALLDVLPASAPSVESPAEVLPLRTPHVVSRSSMHQGLIQPRRAKPRPAATRRAA